jgi:hypothetical protein
VFREHFKEELRYGMVFGEQVGRGQGVLSFTIAECHLARFRSPIPEILHSSHGCYLTVAV